MPKTNTLKYNEFFNLSKCILGCINGEMSTNEITNRVKQFIPRIHYYTVYHYLEQLESDGAVKREIKHIKNKLSTWRKI